METAEFKKLLMESANELKIVLDDKQILRFQKYMSLLKEWNAKFNLTAIEEDRDVALKHFIDSLSIIPCFDSSMTTSVIDIGTGAGFPGIPIKITCENIQVTLLDSLDKRVRFLNEVINQLELKGIKSFHGRAEDFGTKQEFREKFDLAVARAVASLPVLLEYCVPFVKPGGRFIAMKGSSTEEVSQSKKALAILGGEIEDIIEITLPFSDIKRNIIIIRKNKRTPSSYPRKAGKPTKEPLTN